MFRIVYKSVDSSHFLQLKYCNISRIVIPALYIINSHYFINFFMWKENGLGAKQGPIYYAQFHLSHTNIHPACLSLYHYEYKQAVAKP